jgi:hypothetical protein
MIDEFNILDIVVWLTKFGLFTQSAHEADLLPVHFSALSCQRSCHKMYLAVLARKRLMREALSAFQTQGALQTWK